MRPVLRAVLAAVPLTAALTGLAVPTAEAAQHPATAVTWTVTPGGSLKTFSTPGSFALADTATGATFHNCGHLATSIYLKSGSGLPPDIGRVISVATTSPCTGGGLALSLTGGSTKATPWTIKAESQPGTTFGSIHIVNLAATGTGCSFDLNGYLNWALRDQLTIQREITTASNVSGCNGKINNGDPFTLKFLHYDLGSTISISQAGAA